MKTNLKSLLKKLYDKIYLGSNLNLTITEKLKFWVQAPLSFYLRSDSVHD